MKSNADDVSRRSFLKGAAVGALALSSIPTIIIPRRASAYEPGGRIHPNVNPLRVVGLRDPAMIAAEAVPAAWEAQDDIVATAKVHQNLDRLALALAEEGSVEDAWRKILLKPAGKGWSDVVVAVKTNQIAQQRTRSAVMSKVCRVFTDVLGVPGGNIFIYDARHGAGMSEHNPFKGLPEGVHVADQWGGINTPIQVPEPYTRGSSRCMSHLAKGEVDILVNIALCKAHGAQFGNFTLCLKNHFGTFDPGPAHAAGGGADYLIGINKSPAILGEIDQRTGGVMFPRQQLCVVDALWSSKPGPGGPPTHQTNALLMGVFGPAMDYLGGMDFRQNTMGWPVNPTVTRRFLTEFGFTPQDLPNQGSIIDALGSS